jgi:hypothetical protein
MKWTPKWLTAQAINHYYWISARVEGLNEKLLGIPYIKKSNIRCGINGTYWLYDMEYLEILGYKPKASIPERVYKV